MLHHAGKGPFPLREDSLGAIEDQKDEDDPDYHQSNGGHLLFDYIRKVVFQANRDPVKCVEQESTKDNPAVVRASAQDHHDINRECRQWIELIRGNESDEGGIDGASESYYGAADDECLKAE